MLRIDSDIASYIIRSRHASETARFADADPRQVGMSAISQSEMLSGLQKLAPSHPRQRAVRGFLGSVSVYPWGSEAAGVHADIRHRLLSGGITIGAMDTMIAAHAISMDAVLVTNNLRHVSRLAPQLRIENGVSDQPL